MEISTKVTERLLNWYQSSHRILPWRSDPTPYHVWVSEIMLQQTRVEAVIPYYNRFIHTLPDIPSLANADEETLLKLWEGLGYYRRVYNLQKAACIVMEEYQGTLPSTVPQLKKLPGIGDYTAGAIASIAFQRKAAAVDGNVLRVITRLTGDDRDIAGISLKREVTSALETIYPSQTPGDFTQSIMELGAMVCLPNGAPKCDYCPLSDLCYANQNHCTDEFPVKAAKKERRKEKLLVLLLWCDGKIAIEKRKSEGLLHGLWQLPNIQDNGNHATLTDYLKKHDCAASSINHYANAKHIFTHIEWQMSAYQIVCNHQSDFFRWVTPTELQNEVSLPSAFQYFSSFWKDNA